MSLSLCLGSVRRDGFFFSKYHFLHSGILANNQRREERSSCEGGTDRANADGFVFLCTKYLARVFPVQPFDCPTILPRHPGTCVQAKQAYRYNGKLVTSTRSAPYRLWNPEHVPTCQSPVANADTILFYSLTRSQDLHQSRRVSLVLKALLF